MKKMYSIFTVMAGMVILICGPAVYPANKVTSDVDNKIQMACDLLLGNNPGEKCIDGFTMLIDAIELTLPQTSCPAEFNNSIAKASSLFKKNGIFDSQGVQLLREAYRKINNGKDFQVPDEIKEISDAQEYGKKWMNMSRECLKKGKAGEAVKLMLNTAIMVVTPMERRM